MLKLVRKIIFIVTTLMPLTWAASVFAQIASAPPQTSISKSGWSAVISTINLARNWLFGILLAVVVVFILIGAFNFLTAGGDDNKIKKGRGIIKNAIIALVIGILCGGVILLVTSFFDTATNSGTTPSGGVPTTTYGSINPVPPAPLVSGCNVSGCVLPGQICNQTTGECQKGIGQQCGSPTECYSGYCDAILHTCQEPQ